MKHIEAHHFLLISNGKHKIDRTFYPDMVGEIRYLRINAVWYVARGNKIERVFENAAKELDRELLKQINNAERE